MASSFFANRALAFSLLLSIAIATTEVPFWISAFSITLIFWRFLFERWNIYKLSSKITPILGLLIFVIVYLQYKTILGQEESTTVLLGLASLSILNYNTERDSLFLILLGFLLVVLKSVFSLDFIWTIPALISFFGLWMALLKNKKINKLKYLSSIALKSIPVFVLLFFLFPRFVIFQSQQAQKVYAQSGFSEDLNPWKVGEMNLQNQIVFRADFRNSSMNSEELYWRGAVLNVSSGFSWQKGVVEKVITRNEEDIDHGVAYRIILEPQTLKNIFVLEHPLAIRSASSPIVEMQHKNFSLVELSTQQVQFEGLAAFNHSTATDSEDPPQQKKYIGLTSSLPPRTKAFIEEVKLKNSTPIARIDALKKFFTGKGFVYSLKPGVYQNNLDEFLFERKKGFCEHYASALGTMARALEIPARVVLGYQGGQYNDLGSFWKISQRDAHAWVEVGLDGKWVRIDPTGWVSPLRLSLGGEQFFSLSEDEQILYSKDKSWRRPKGFRSIFDEITQAFENLNYYWTLLLLNYDLQAQLDYLKRIKANGVLVLVLILTLVGVFIYSRRYRKNEFPYRHRMHELILNIEAWAEKNGLKAEVNETPLQLMQRIQSLYPNLATVLDLIKQEYIRAAYQNIAAIDSVDSLRRKWIVALKENNSKEETGE